jgi:hypothetical protein
MSTDADTAEIGIKTTLSASSPGSNAFTEFANRTTSLFNELRVECIPTFSREQAGEALEFAKKNLFVPYLPAFWSPGWLTRYALGPFNQEWLDNFVGDFAAGITVSLTLIPQVNVVRSI